MEDFIPMGSPSAAAATTAAPAPVRARPTQGIRDSSFFYASLLAGAGSGAVSSVLCAPLDLVRVRMQVWGAVMDHGHPGRRGTTRVIPTMVRDIWRRDGARGFFRGLGATLLTVPVFWGVYFPLYEFGKHEWARRSPGTNTAAVHMGAAVAAGAVADVVCNPMFVVRTRLQTEALHDAAAGVPPHRPTTIRGTARALLREGGATVFWRGMSANLLGLSHVAIQFPVYERLKRTLRGDKPRESVVDLLLATSLSKMSASLVSYPHEVIRSRMMDARAAHVGFFRTCSAIYASEGALGFYTGLQVTMARVVPNTCVTFITYELLLRWARTQMADRPWRQWLL